MSYQFDSDFLRKAIVKAVEREVDEEIKRVAEQAKFKIEEILTNSADKIALNILEQYNIHDNKSHIVIEVKKAIGDK